MNSTQIKRILLVNSKGGCGKTTIATNLSSYYASKQIPTVLIDHDPQASSTQWLEFRDPNLTPISGIAAFKQPQAGVTKSWAMRMPPETKRVIIDTPAGFSKHELMKQASQADFIIIPVLPSPIDIRALGGFIKDLYFASKIRQHAQIAVVANRVKKGTLVFNSLEVFLQKLNIPFITTLRDTQNYVKAAEHGLGIHEFAQSTFHLDQAQWSPLIEWIEGHHPINDTRSPKDSEFKKSTPFYNQRIPVKIN